MMSKASAPRRMRYDVIGVLGVITMIVLALGWIVARDLQQSAEDTHQLYQGFEEIDELTDDLLLESEEVRRILLYALHTTGRQSPAAIRRAVARRRSERAASARQPAGAARHPAHA